MSAENTTPPRRAPPGGTRESGPREGRPASVHVPQLLVGARLDLEGGVNDPEALVDRLFDSVQRFIAAGVSRLVDPHVPRERRKPRGEAPDVQVVDLEDPWKPGDGGRHVLAENTGWRPFQQHVDRLAHAADCPDVDH